MIDHQQQPYDSITLFCLLQTAHVTSISLQLSNILVPKQNINPPVNKVKVRHQIMEHFP